MMTTTSTNFNSARAKAAGAHLPMEKIAPPSKWDAQTATTTEMAGRGALW